MDPVTHCIAQQTLYTVVAYSPTLLLPPFSSWFVCLLLLLLLLFLGGGGVVKQEMDIFETA